MPWNVDYETLWLDAPGLKEHPSGAVLKDKGPGEKAEPCGGSVSIVECGPSKFILGSTLATANDGQSSNALTLWYAGEQDGELTWLTPHPGKPNPMYLSETSGMGLDLAVPPGVGAEAAPGSYIDELYVGWTGTDESHTVNIALCSEPTAPGVYTKTIFRGHSSNQAAAVAAVTIPSGMSPHDKAEAVGIIAWLGTDSVPGHPNLRNVGSLPGTSTEETAILSRETSRYRPNLMCVGGGYFGRGTGVPGEIFAGPHVLLSWVGDDAGNSLNFMDFDAFASPISASRQVIVPTPSACAPALAFPSTEGEFEQLPSIIAWIDRDSGKLAVARADGNLENWSEMTYLNLQSVEPSPDVGVSIVNWMNTGQILIACVDKVDKLPRVFALSEDPATW